MKLPHLAVLVAGVLLIGMLAGGTTVALAAGSSVRACITHGGLLRSATARGTCPRRTHQVAIGQSGPAGAPGPQGTQGPGSTDIIRTLPALGGTPTFVTLATVPGLTVRAYCYRDSSHPGLGMEIDLIPTPATATLTLLGQQMAANVASSLELELAGTYSVGSGVSAGYTGMVAVSGAAYHVDVVEFADDPGNQCRVSGQITP